MSELTTLVAPNTANVKRVLRKGMQGEDVKYMQEILVELNDHYKFCPTKYLKNSGKFGNETEKFLKFFQYWVSLERYYCYFERNTSNAMESTYEEYLDDMRMKVLFARTKQQLDDMANRPDPFDRY